MEKYFYFGFAELTAFTQRATKAVKLLQSLIKHYCIASVFVQVAPIAHVPIAISITDEMCRS